MCGCSSIFTCLPFPPDYLKIPDEALMAGDSQGPTGVFPHQVLTLVRRNLKQV